MQQTPVIYGRSFRHSAGSTQNWLVVWNINFIFPLILGMSSSQLTNSYFSEGWPNHQPAKRCPYWTLENGQEWSSARHPGTLKRTDENFIKRKLARSWWINHPSTWSFYITQQQSSNLGMVYWLYLGTVCILATSFWKEKVICVCSKVWGWALAYFGNGELVLRLSF